MRTSFVFYGSWWEAIKNLQRDVQGDVLTAIIEYGLTGETTEQLKPIAKAMLAMAKIQIDVNNQRFENGKRGGRPNQTETKGKPNNNQTETKGKPNDNENENENDFNNPPTPPKGEAINKKARLAFEEHYRQVFGNDYYWTAKDAGAMSRLIQKLRFQRQKKQLDVSDDSIILALGCLLSSINEGWIFENFSVTNIDSKFNEIVSQIKTARNGNNHNACTSKQEANAYALSLLQQHKRELEEGMDDEVERPF